MKCNECRMENIEGALFCEECGAKLGTENELLDTAIEIGLAGTNPHTDRSAVGHVANAKAPVTQASTSAITATIVIVRSGEMSAPLVAAL